MTSADASWVGLEIRHLQALEAVAREGSFRGAAQRLGYVQSAISHQILALERVVGTTLVQRTRGSRRSSLTPAGEAVLEHASAILARVRAAQVDLTAIAEGRNAALRVGSFQKPQGQGFIAPAKTNEAGKVNDIAARLIVTC